MGLPDGGGTISAGHRDVTPTGDGALARGEDVAVLQRVDHDVDVVRDLLPDVARLLRLHRAAPDELTALDVVEARLRDVDVILVNGRRLVIARPGAVVAAIEAIRRRAGCIRARPDLGLLLDLDQPRRDRRVDVGLAHAFVQARFLDGTIFGQEPIALDGVDAFLFQACHELVFERAPDARLLGDPDDHDPLEVGRRVLRVAPLIDDARRAAPGSERRQGQSHSEHVKSRTAHDASPCPWSIRGAAYVARAGVPWVKTARAPRWVPAIDQVRPGAARAGRSSRPSGSACA